MCYEHMRHRYLYTPYVIHVSSVMFIEPLVYNFIISMGLHFPVHVMRAGRRYDALADVEAYERVQPAPLEDTSTIL